MSATLGVIGAIGLTVIAALIIAAFQAEDLPFIGGGEHHSAAFREAAGIQEGNEVRVAGVKVGKVTGIDLEGQHVRIDFRVDHGTELGSRTGRDDPAQDRARPEVPGARPGGPGALDRARSRCRAPPPRTT